MNVGSFTVYIEQLNCKISFWYSSLDECLIRHFAGLKWNSGHILRGAVQEYTHYALFKIKIMNSTIFTN